MNDLVNDYLEETNKIEKQVETDLKINEILDDEPLNFFANTLQKKHIGDRLLLELGILSGLSVKLSKIKLNLYAKGKSGKGKSDLFETVLLIFPEINFIKTTSLSRLSLYYKVKENPEELDNKIIFVDEFQASQDIAPVMRSITSQNEFITPTHLTVEKQKGLEIKIKGDFLGWFTSVLPVPDNELLNRVIEINPAEGYDIDKKVWDYQDKRYRLGKETDPLHADFEISKSVVKNIIDNTNNKKTIIPYEIQWPDKHNRRLYPFFLTIIKIITKINYKKRYQIGDFIIASDQDFNKALEIWNLIKQETTKSINKEYQNLLELIPAGELNKIKRSQLSLLVSKSDKFEKPMSTRQVRYICDDDTNPNNLWSKGLIEKTYGLNDNDKINYNEVYYHRISQRDAVSQAKIVCFDKTKVLNTLVEACGENLNMRNLIQREIEQIYSKVFILNSSPHPVNKPDLSVFTENKQLCPALQPVAT